MADLDDTIEKLVAVAKRKGYVGDDTTVESLKAEAAKGKEDDAVSLMTAMKKNLDAQTGAVRLPTRCHAQTPACCAAYLPKPLQGRGVRRSRTDRCHASA